MSVEGEQEFVEQVAEAIAAVTHPGEAAEEMALNGRMYRRMAEAAVGVMVERLGPSF